MKQYDFGQLVSGKNASFKTRILRFFLSVISQVYQIVVVSRNFLYSRGWLKIRQVNAIVISVGNITVGGTGKTPLVIWLCKFLHRNDAQCAILTRGYKATQNLKLKTQNYSDEPAIIAESCPQVRVIVNPDRVAGANEAVNKFGAKLLIMDDGFQHRRLARGFDIVTIDATLPFGYGKLLPAGLLREPVICLKRADAIVITRCNQVSETELSRIEKKLQEVKPDVIIARSIHSPVCAKTIDNKEINIEQLKGKKIFAFCGIGNPDSFINAIKGLGANLAGSKIYDDHYHYADKDIDDIYKQAKDSKAELILTTQKDWSKIIGDFRFPISDFQSSILFACLEIELKLIRGEDVITQLIKDTLAGKMAKN